MIRVTRGTAEDAIGYIRYVSALNPKVVPKRLPNKEELLTIVHRIGGGTIITQDCLGNFFKIYIGTPDKHRDIQKVIEGIFKEARETPIRAVCS